MTVENNIPFAKLIADAEAKMPILHHSTGFHSPIRKPAERVILKRNLQTADPMTDVEKRTAEIEARAHILGNLPNHK